MEGMAPIILIGSHINVGPKRGKINGTNRSQSGLRTSRNILELCRRMVDLHDGRAH